MIATMIMLMVKLSQTLTLILDDETCTQSLGVAIAPSIAAGFVLHLQGDLGAGKTTLTRALLRAVGVFGTLRSPTFALLEPYDIPQLSGGILHHFDFYRLEDSPRAWRDAGFEEAFSKPHAAIVEWPQYAHGLPSPDVAVMLHHLESRRQADIIFRKTDVDLMQRLTALGAVS
jgi:tRNA threonylcarbamoyladenosine biosynthesis protein TsaE